MIMAEPEEFALDGIDVGQHAGLQRLKELVRHGYVPEKRPLSGNDGLVLRHDNAPDLVLRSDGSVDVPLGQPLKRNLAADLLPPRSHRRWKRFGLILVGLALYTVAALAVLVTAMGGL